MKNAVLIGLGMVADTHLAAFRDANTVMLSGIMGRDPEKARAYGRHAADLLGHAVKTYQNTDEIAADPGVDFVVIATPPDARRDLIAPLVRAGKPILMEKPVERTLEAAQDIVTLCADHAVPLGIVFQHRARAASQALKQALDQGKLGDITNAEIRVPWWRDQGYYDTPGRGTYARDGGGVMISQAIHTLDLALWLLGPFSTISAHMHRTALHRLEAENWAGALFETVAGCVGTLTATTSAFPGTAETISLHGTKASAHLESGVLTISYLDGQTETHGASATTGGGADPMAFTHAWHQSVIEDFAQAITDQRDPMATGKQALMAHAVIDAMERSGTSRVWEKVAQV